MEKTFCDKCNKDITNDEQFDCDLYDMTTEKSVVKVDLCKKCAEIIKQKLKEKIKGD